MTLFSPGRCGCATNSNNKQVPHAPMVGIQTFHFRIAQFNGNAWKVGKVKKVNECLNCAEHDKG
ncbi:CLUMA_CG002762, isoform A [Clunio marinus]|uniref:CLUMA_CG002762, isoform A n=1 Tax=Clunio marinus TaxID=568069 RepID=A0A1J1HQT8_9DIPT|nr:CLUMA_CG002762, isoform A [Clunio marinus]